MCSIDPIKEHPNGQSEPGRIEQTVHSVTIHAQEVKVVEEKEILPPSRRATYVTNAVLFAFLMLLATIWFTAHVKAYVTQKAVMSIITWFAVAQMLVSFLKTDFEKAATDVRKRWLTTTRTTQTLLVALVATLGLFMTTSSLYVKLDSGHTRPVKIDVLTARGKLMPTIEIDHRTVSDGQPFFPRFTTATVRFSVREPRGYDLSEGSIEFRPWTRREFSFPTDFTKRSLHVLRIVPGVTINSELTLLDDESTHVLRVTTPAGEEVAAIDTYLFETVYIGSTDREDLQFTADQEQASLRREARIHLAKKGALKWREMYLALWSDAPRLETTRRALRKEERLIITLRDKRYAEPLVTMPTLAPKGELRTVFLERSQ